MDKDAYKLLIAIGSCHRLMKEKAIEIRTRPSVKSVTHWLDVYDVDGAFRLEAYVDAELSNKRLVGAWS